MSTLARAWRGEAPLLSAALTPLSWAYGLGARAHRGLVASGAFRRARAELPIVSVGNLVAGGAGKTPVTLELARRLMRAGLAVAVLSRGYGRSSHGLVVVSDGATCAVSASDGGDEPVWLARKLPGLVVIAAENRAEAACRAKALQVDIALLDDGFSHHMLARDEDILVVDSTLGFGNRRLLPAGPLREPASQARRATLAWLTRCESASAEPPAELLEKPLVRSRYVATSLAGLDLAPQEPLAALRHRPIVAVSGIARPEEFAAALRALGASIDRHHAFGDHHRFTPAEVAALERQAAGILVTTEKDAVRLQPLASPDRWRALAMEVEVIGDASALDAVVRRFARPRGTA